MLCDLMDNEKRNSLMEIAHTGHSKRPRIKFLETDEGGKKKRTAAGTLLFFRIEGRGIRMIFGIINNANNGEVDGADDGEVNGEVNGDKDIAKMHNEREMEEKKLRKTRARLHI